MKAAYPTRFPSEVWAEIQRLPVGFLEDVVEAEAYMQAKRVVDAAKTKADLPTDSPMVDLVQEITHDQALAEKARRSPVVADGNVGMRGAIRRG